MARWRDKAVAAVLGLTTLLSSLPAAAEPVSLRSFAAQQAHLAEIAYRIAAANADRCQTPQMFTGMLVHDLSQYDPAVRPAVATAFSLHDGIGVIQIVPGSAAERAGFHVDDEIVAIGRQSVSDPAAIIRPQKSYARIERFTKMLDAALRAGPVELLVRRGGMLEHVSLQGRAGCGGQVLLANDHDVNAWSDGEQVMVTTGMVQLAQTDDQLAFVIAHEMAHNILGHSRSSPAGIFGFRISKARRSELEADGTAVGLLARAGYAPQGAVNFLERARRRFWWDLSIDHPGFGRRIATVNAVIAALPEARSFLPRSAPATALAAAPASSSVATEIAPAAREPVTSPELAGAKLARLFSSQWLVPQNRRLICQP